MKPTILFYSGVELANRGGDGGATQRARCLDPENNGEPHRYNSPTWARGPNPGQPH
jgi:hypothetical protein